jgi:ABC-2 type transport system permease protein
MKTALAVATREMGAYFRSTSGWVIIALYLFLTGVVFAAYVLVPGKPASLRDFFAISGWLLLPVVPAISMRLIADELKLGTFESLLTAPIRGSWLVLGKFLGGLGFLLAMLIPTTAYAFVLFRFSQPQPDIGPLISGYACLVLLGVMYLSIGLLASTLTSNATLAFMMTLFAILSLLFVGSLYDFAGPARPIVAALTLGPRIMDFSRGVIDTSHVVFFLSFGVLFLFMSVVSVELRRWR